MLSFVFRCPVTGYVAKAVVPNDKAAEGERPRYRLVRCMACRGIHFVDPATGDAIAATRNPDDEPQR
jgi:hypothetical protein